jgi:MFS family permease
MRSDRVSSELALLGTAGLWCFTNGMTLVLVPLYAIVLGFSILKISNIVAVPVLATLVVRFVVGAFSDRFGERRVLQSCYFLMALSALMLLGAKGYFPLMVVVIVMNLSRSTFWTPVQSLASQLGGGNVGKKLGQLSAVNYTGTLLGQILAGVMAAYLGYRSSFLVLTGATILCFLLGFALPQSKAKPVGRTVWQIAWGIGRSLRYPRTWLIISGSGAASLPMAMTVSLSVYLAHLNFGEQWIGLAISLRSLGPIAIGLLMGVSITLSRQRFFYGLGMIILGLCLVGSGFLDRYWLLIFCIVVLGAAGGVMDLLQQVQAAAMSGTSDRSVAMASTGMGWHIVPFFLPIIVGWLVEMWGFNFAFLLTGLFLVFIGAFTSLWFRLLAPDGITAGSVGWEGPATGEQASSERG